MKQNVASQNISAQMTTVADGSDFTGTVTVTVTKDNGTQTAGAGTVTHKGGGEHNYAPTQAETNAAYISFNFAGTGAITAGLKLYTQFPQTVDNDTKIALIKTKTDFLPSVTSGGAGGLFIAGVNAATTVTTSFTTTFTGNLTGSVASVTGAAGSVTGTVGSVTGNVGGNVAGSVNSVTTAVTVGTNNDKTGYSVSTLAANVITASSVAASALDGKGDWNINKTGYSLTITPPTAIENRQEMDTNSVDLNTLIVGQSTINGNVLAIPTNPNTVVPDNAGIASNGVAIGNLNNITAAQVLAAGDIDGFSLEEAQKLILAVNAGVLAGAATATMTMEAADGSKTRITATTDVDGNRTTVIKDATG